MATSRLKIYNDALIICGERTLSSLTENREPRYLLDQVWDNDGVKYCLESGQWRFATRSQQIDYDITVTPAFGYARAFQKPSDWCATVAISEDEYFNSALLNYHDKNGYWYCDLDTIYISFISDHADFGGDLTLWSAKFTDYVASHFAAKIILKLTADEKKRVDVLAIENKRLQIAKNHDAMGEPVKFPPEGNWNASRRGRSSSDRGRRNSLTG